MRERIIARVRLLRAQTRSVRFRTAAAAAVVVAVALVIGSIAVTVLQERALRANVDQTLKQRADDLAALLASGELPAVLGGTGDETLVQLVDAEGRVVAASLNLGGSGPIVESPAADGQRRLRTYPSLPIDDDPFRVLAQRVDGPQGPLTLYAGASLDPVDESTAALRRTLAIGVPLMVLLVGGVTSYFVRRALAPVEAIRAEVAAIGGGALQRRVPEPGADDEVARLARTMNAMLERLETAQRAQRQFVADASHELRSPLTSIRAQIEVELAQPQRADGLAMGRAVLAETARLEALADDLLLLAQGDVSAPLRREPVDLDEVVLEEARRLRVRGVRVDTSGVSGAQLLGDRRQLERAVRNLLENAGRFARTDVTVGLAEDDVGGEITLVVADDGPGVPPEARERIFERFHRGDEGRGRSHGGSGLGLAIVREVVTRHGGYVEVDPSYGGGARFVVRFPRGRH